MTTELEAPTETLPKRKVRTKTSAPKDKRVNWPVTIVMMLGTVVILVPLYFTVAMAVKSDAEAVSGSGFAWPWPMHLENFKTAWELTDFPRAFTISLAVTLATVAGSIVLASMAAYAIARNWERKVFRYSYFYLLAAMFIPFPVIALPQIKLTSMLNLDNPAGVALLHILFGMAFNILLYSAYLRSIPLEIEESARIDGCSTSQVFWKLVFPLLGPMNATVGIFAFLQSWNDFMMPSLITADPTWQTLPVIQQIFQLAFATNYNISFASYLMAMAPTIVAYLFAQRWVMSGVTRGAIK